MQNYTNYDPDVISAAHGGQGAFRPGDQITLRMSDSAPRQALAEHVTCVVDYAKAVAHVEYRVRWGSGYRMATVRDTDGRISDGDFSIIVRL